MTDLPDNVTLEWLAHHLIDFREETRRELRGLREDVDRLTVIARSLRDEADVTGAILIRVERPLERLERERQD